MSRPFRNCLGLSVCALAAPLSLASTIITLQQGSGGYTGTGDAWLDDSQERDNNGGDPSLRIKYNSGRSDATIVRFDLAGMIPANQRILLARLHLYYGSAESMGPSNAILLTCYRIDPNMPWFENIYTGQSGVGVSWRWRDPNETQAWTSQDGAWWDKINDGNGSVWIQDTDGEVGGNPPPVKPSNWVTFTVTNSVKAWYEQGRVNNGLSFFSENFVGTGYIGAGLFVSRNNSTAWARPKLEITYEGALLPIAEAGGPYTVSYGGSVNFNGSASYDPDGGSIVSYLWDLDNDGQYDDATGAQFARTWDYLVYTLGLTPGNHTIGLRVTDDENESQTDTAQLTILPQPIACCLPAGGCAVILPSECAAQLGYPAPGGVCLGDWDNNGIDDACEPVTACCLPDGRCRMLLPVACAECGGFVPPGGICLGDLNANGVDDACEVKPCAANANCDHAVTWRDIDYFVAGMNDNCMAWYAKFPGGPECPFSNLDCNGDGHVTWRDISPFVGWMNTTCPH